MGIEKTKEDRKAKQKRKKEKPEISDIKEVSNEREISKQDKYLYVYGIINNEDIELDLKGIKDKPIKKINFKDVAVLFSFYPVLCPVLEEKEAMLHAGILNKIADRTTIVPMAFGMVFKDKEILETVLTTSYLAVKKTLELIKDKIELGIKVLKKEEGEMLGEVNQKILEELNNLSVKSIAGDIFSERLLLNHSFLVERNKFTQFSDKVGELEKKYSDLKFIYTGPWSVYSFVNIDIKAG